MRQSTKSGGKEKDEHYSHLEIGLIGIAIAGGAMLWGGELTEFGRRACMIGLVVSVLVFAAPMLASAFGVNAAVV